MCSKVSSFCMIVFLLFFTLSSSVSARPQPSASALQYAADTPTKLTQQYLDSTEAEKVEVEDSCEGIKAEEEEECLMRRTLAAHVDYIYTQKTKP
ncbi:hypothetical protein PTKIN_Ptkin02bG0164700 [Pterospermum kingtungense]